MSKGVIDLDREHEAQPGIPAHSPFGPSGAEGWMGCPAYVKMNAMYPSESSVYALEGTCAHAVAERVLLKDKEVRDYKGKVFVKEGYRFEVTEQVIDYLEPGIDRIREFGGTLYTEQKVKLHRWLPNNFGTLDRGVITKKLIVVGDLKYGAGEPVSPKRNKQMMLYALAFWWYVARKVTDAKKFLLIVDQPRNAEGGGEWEVHLDELLAFGEEVKAAYAAANAKKPEFIPGAKQCRWCKHKDNCEARERWQVAMLKADFKRMEEYQESADENKPLFLPEFDPARLRRFLYIHRHASQIREFLDMVHTELLRMGMDGKDIGEYMVASGRRGPKRWRDETKARRALFEAFGNKAYDKVLKSPTQLLEKVGKAGWSKDIENMVTQDPGKPALVLKTSGKKALPSLKDGFKKLNERSDE